MVTHFGCHFKPSLHWQYSPGDVGNILNGGLGGSENIALYEEGQCGFTVWPNFHPGPASVTVRAVWSPKVGTGCWKSRHTEMPPAQDPLSWVGALPEDRCNIFTCCFDLWRGAIPRCGRDCWDPSLGEDTTSNTASKLQQVSQYELSYEGQI